MSVTLADVVLADEIRPGDLIGHTSKGTPVFAISGGESDDDPDDDGDDDDDSEDDDDDSDDKDEDITIKASEKKRMQSALAKRKAELKEARAEAARLKAEMEKNGKKKGKENDDDGPDEETVKSLREEGAKGRDDFWRPLFIRKAAVAAIAAAGYNGKNPERMAKLLDVSDIEVDEDGELDGLEDAIRELKEEHPDLFKRKAPGSADTRERSDDDGNGKKRISKDDEAQLKQLGVLRSSRR